MAKKKEADLTPLVFLGAFLLLTRRIQAPGPVEAGPAQVSGSLGLLQVEMGSHLAVKLPGDVIKATVPWEATTRNSLGASIPWRYRLTFLLGHSTLAGWKRSGELGFPESGSRTLTWDAAQGSLSGLGVFSAPDDPDQQWDVHVILEGAVSDMRGQPTAEWQRLIEAKHDRAVITKRALAQVSGSLGAVTVSQAGLVNTGFLAQRRRRRFGRR